MNRRLTTLLSLAFFSTVAVGVAVAKPGRAQKKPAATTTEVKPVMAQFLVNLQALQPYLASESAYADQRNHEEIQKRLNSLVSGVNSLNHFDALKTPGFSVSAGVLQDHVRQTHAAFKRGRTEYSRWMLNETVQTCISCHSQLPSGATALVVPVDTVKGSAIERGDFLFATRQFDEALKVYDQVIAGFQPPARSGGIVQFEPAETAFRRKLAIFLRVRRDPESAAKSLENDLRNGGLPGGLAETVHQWIIELRKPGLLPPFQPKTATRAELEAYATRILGEDVKGLNLFTSPTRAANYLVLSGVLYEALSASRADLPQSEILYWLSKTDRGLNRDFLSSMSDLYLQECIRRAPHTPVAKQCFRDYEESTTLQYTGSRGTDLPADVREMLAKLRQLSK